MCWVRQRKYIWSVENVFYYCSNACELSVDDETEYMVVKKLCQVMVQLGHCQLLPLWVLYWFCSLLCCVAVGIFRLYTSRVFRTVHEHNVIVSLSSQPGLVVPVLILNPSVQRLFALLVWIYGMLSSIINTSRLILSLFQ